MRVLVTSTEGTGHLDPLLPFITALRERGDEVALLVPPGAVARARTTGAEVWTNPLPPEEELTAMWQRFGSAPRAEAAVIANREIFGRLFTAAALPTVDRKVRDWRPDVVLHEPAEYAGAIAAERYGVTHVQVAISLAEVEAGSLDLAAPVLLRYGAGLVDAIRRSPYLSKFPADLDPSPYPGTVRYRDPTPAHPIIDEKHLEPVEGSQLPLVYITFGTVTRSIPGSEHFYRAVLDAVAGLAVRVLLTTGPGPMPDLGSLPPNVRVESWTDQAEVLTQARVVLCHGGSGTVFGALAAGVPVVVAALFADQPVNAGRVVSAGAGLSIVRVPGSATDRLTLDEAALADVRDAVGRVLTQPEFRLAAQAISARMRSAPDIDTVLSTVLPR